MTINYGTKTQLLEWLKRLDRDHYGLRARDINAVFNAYAEKHNEIKLVENVGTAAYRTLSDRVEKSTKGIDTLDPSIHGIYQMMDYVSKQYKTQRKDREKITLQIQNVNMPVKRICEILIEQNYELEPYFQYVIDQKENEIANKNTAYDGIMKLFAEMEMI